MIVSKCECTVNGAGVTYILSFVMFQSVNEGGGGAFFIKGSSGRRVLSAAMKDVNRKIYIH